jgi:transposase
MAGRPHVVASAEQLSALQELSRSDRRDEADRARAVVLSVNGWTSGQIARAFGVTPDSVRRWRSWFAATGVDGLRAGEHTGREPVKSEAAAAVAAVVLTAPVADRPNWTLPRLQAEIVRRHDLSISKSQLSKALKKTATDGAAPDTACAAGKTATLSTEQGCG